MAIATLVVAVSGEGFMMTVQPAARAETSLRQGRKIGKFHLVVSTYIPRHPHGICRNKGSSQEERREGESGGVTHGESSAAGPTGSRLVK